MVKTKRETFLLSATCTLQKDYGEVDKRRVVRMGHKFLYRFEGLTLQALHKASEKEMCDFSALQNQKGFFKANWSKNGCHGTMEWA